MASPGKKVVAALALALSAACSFEPPPASAPLDQGADASPALDQDSTGAEMGPAGEDMPTPEDMTPPTDQGSEDMASPPTDMPSPQDMTPPEDMAPAEDMTSPPDMDMPAEEMGWPPMPALCEGNRVDLSIDPNNCGMCGVSCDPKFGECRGGQCVCTDASLEVCGASRRCVDTKIDPNHCGNCGFECGPAAACQDEKCVCRPGFIECGGECVDPDSDPRHCGMCDRPCNGNSCKNGSCRDNDRCGFAYQGCDVTGGTACLPDEHPTNDLYCRPGSNFDLQCGERCGGDELCDKPDLLDVRQCFRYRPGRTCTSCPCDDCGRGEICREAFGVPDRVYCVKVE